MDAKESLCALLESLTELNKKTPRTLLVDFVTGNASSAIKEHQLVEHELFGCGDKHDEDYFNMVIDQAIADKYLKTAENELSITAKGKKYLKAPTPYVIEENDEQGEPDGNALENVDDFADTEQIVPSASSDSIGSHAKVKIQLIQAMDRKIALDDFAEQNNMEFDEVLDVLESLKSSGRKFDITYFVDEVLGEESLDELCEYFNTVDGDIAKTIKEYGDVYEPEEIRLAHLTWEEKK